LLITIFYCIFKITPFEELPDTLTLNASLMTWYLVITELISFAGGTQNFHDVRSDVLNGQFTTSLQRPKSYFCTKWWTWVGANIARISALLVPGLILGLCYTHNFAYNPTHIPFLISSIYLGTLIFSTVYFMLGILEIWGPYSRQAMWIFQKLTFLLGGLILPLQLYPEWLQTIAWLTPFPAILYIPGTFAFNPDLQTLTHHLGIQVVWLALVILAALFVE
ncbi:MAG: ABC-2 family transporter protein, partial [Gammaproteobacteria bacterium]